MTRAGPMVQSLLRSRKSLALHASISDAIAAAFLEEPDDALPRVVIAALSRIEYGASVPSQVAVSGSDHWFAARLFLDPVILSAATMRAARIIDGASGLGLSIGFPRRANDFPDVTPFGLGLFYEASLHHSRQGGPSFKGLDTLFSVMSVESALSERASSATLADALLLSLVPSAKGHLTNAARQGQVTKPDETSELSQMSDILAGLRQGRLPDALPRTRLAADLLGRESFHGFLQAATRLGAASGGMSGQWPALIAGYLPGGSAGQSGSGVADVPLIICALASTWLKVSWSELPPARKEALLSDFSSLVAGCAHEQAGSLSKVLNRNIA